MADFETLYQQAQRSRMTYQRPAEPRKPPKSAARRSRPAPKQSKKEKRKAAYLKYLGHLSNRLRALLKVGIVEINHGLVMTALAHFKGQHLKFIDAPTAQFLQGYLQRYLAGLNPQEKKEAEERAAKSIMRFIRLNRFIGMLDESMLAEARRLAGDRAVNEFLEQPRKANSNEARSNRSKGAGHKTYDAKKS